MVIDLQSPSKELSSAITKLTEDFKQKKVIPFVGSGISISPPSCVPTGGKIQQVLVNYMVDAAFDFLDRFGEKEKWKERSEKGVKQKLFSFMLEKILGHISDVYEAEEVSDTVLKTLNQEEPNTNHVSLATLLSNKTVPAIITLNFDNLIEKALQKKKVKPIRICPIRYDFDYNKLEGKPLIIKPHGTFPDPEKSETQCENPDVIFTSQKIGLFPDPHTERCLMHFTRNKSLLIAGYSDDDVDIFPIYQNLHPEEVYNIYWVVHVGKLDQEDKEKSELIKKKIKFYKWWFGEKGYEADDEELKERLEKIYPAEQLDVRLFQQKRSRKLAEWLVTRSPKSIIFIGDVIEIWRKIFGELNLDFEEVKGNWVNRELGLDFIKSEDNLPYTAFLMGHLLEDSGERDFSVEGLLANLYKGDYFKNDPDTKIFMLNRYSSGLYVIEEPEKYFEVLSKIKPVLKQLKNSHDYWKAETLLQMGYLNLSYYKTLRDALAEKKYGLVLKGIIKFLKGWFLLSVADFRFLLLGKNGESTLGADYGSGKHRSKDRRWIVRFYRGDVFNNFARWILSTRGIRSKLATPLLRIAKFYYNRAMKLRQDYSLDFYHLRLVETKLLLNEYNDTELSILEKKVELSCENYRRLSNDQQIGYTNIMKALILFRRNPDEVKEIKEYLVKAQQEFDKSKSGRASVLVQWFSQMFGVSIKDCL